MIHPGIQSVFPLGIKSGFGVPGFVGGSGVPGDPIALWEIKNGVLQPDVIGLSISEVYPLTDPALRSIISADDGATWRDAAEIITLALAHADLNSSTMGGSEAKGIFLYDYLMVPVVAPAITLTKACKVMGATYTPPTGPDAFAFTDATGAELTALTESNAITLAGSTVALPFTVTGGTAQIDGAGDWVTSGMAPAGCTIKVRRTSSDQYETAASVVLTINGVSDTFTVTTRANALEFTVINYNAAWTPPSITAATLTDANVIWTRPDLTTFTGKAPAMTNFSQTGVYRCVVTNWAAVTSFSFYPGSTQSWISRLNFVTMLPSMTGLTSLVIRNIPSLVESITNLVFPSSLTSLSSFLVLCSGITGNITNIVIPTGVTNLSSFLYGCTTLTGTCPNPSALTSCTTYSNMLNGCLSVTGDVSTWTWRTNITNAAMPATRLTYGTGQSLRANVRSPLTFSLDNCDLLQADVGRILIDLNISGATGGTCALNTNNDAPDWGTEGSPSDVAYAVADLYAKSWVVTPTGGVPAWVLLL